MATEIGRLSAVFEANTQDFDAKMKRLESSIKMAKDRIKELKAEAGSPFKAAQTEALEAHLKKLTAEYKTLQKAQRDATASTKQHAQALNQDLGGALSTLSPRLGALAGAAGPLTVVAGGLVALGAAGAGIYKLATFSQQLGGDIYDLSTKINFTAETLSALKVAAETSGGSLESLSTSLGIFDRNMEEAKDKTSEMSRIFKILKLDTNDNEKALRQAFVALGNMASGSQQTAIAMKLFGRSGKEILGIIKETGGNVDAFIDKMREMGLVITSDGAKKADQFGDRIIILQDKLAAIGRQIGTELVPTVERAADDISRWLKENQGEILKTAKELAELVSGFYTLAKVVASPFIAQIIIMRRVMDVAGSVAGPRTPGEASSLESGTLDSGSLNAPASLPQGLPRLSVFQQRPDANAPHTFSPFANPNRGAPTSPLDFTKPSSGGGGGGGGAKKQEDTLKGLRAVVMGLASSFRELDTELLSSANASALAAEKEKILSSMMHSLNEKTQITISQMKNVDEALTKAIGSLPAKSQAAAKALVDQALAQFKTNEQTRIAGILNKQAEELTKGWRQEMENTKSGADEYTKQIQELEKAFQKYGVTLDAGTRKELEYLSAVQRTLKLTRERTTILAQTRPRVVGGDILKELGGGSAVFTGGASRERVATVDEQVLRDRLASIREKAAILAGDLTGIFERSIADGISGGAKKGLQSMVLSFLDMIQQVVLGRLKAALAEALGGIASGGSGKGGFFGGLLRAILGGAASGAAGGVGGGATAASSTNAIGAIHFAQGGLVPGFDKGYDSVPAMLRPGEYVVPRGGGAGDVTNNFTINLPPAPNTSYSPKRSARQQADMVMAALQGAR